MNNNALYSALLAWLWQTTWQSTVLAVVVLVATRILRRWLTPQVRQVLWLLVFLRLVMPNLPASRLSAFTWIQSRQQPIESIDIAMPQLVTTVTSPPIEYPAIKVSPSRPHPQLPVSRFEWSTALLVIWLAGAVGIFGKVVVSNVIFARKLKARSRACDLSTIGLVASCCREMAIENAPAILMTDIVNTPSLHGAIVPQLLLPAGMISQIQPAEFRLIILHELEHLCRHHLMVDWLLSAICSLHWFNPVTWQVHRRIRAARELICDRAVLINADDDSSRQYGLAMLDMATKAGRENQSIQLAAFAAEQNDLQQRIEAIASRRRKYIFGLGAIVVLAVAVVFLTRPTSPVTPLVKTITPTTSPSAETIAELIQLSRSLTEEHDYIHALQIIDRILQLDPRNDYALGSRPKVEDRMLIQKQNAFRDEYDRQTSNGSILKNPASRPTLSGRRSATSRLEENADLLAKLDRKLPELKFDAVGFSDVIDFLRDVSSTSIFVNWRALEAAGVSRTTPVTARLRDVKFSKALEIILREVGGEKVKLAYSANEGVLTIATADDLAEASRTNVYDIRDLIMPLEGKDATHRAERTAQLIKLIRSIVAADSWKDNGGKSGLIRELGGQLIITQTPDNQRAITQLIEQLRETRGLQISIESKLIELSDMQTAELLALQAAQSATRPAIVPTTQPDRVEGGILQVGETKLRTLIAESSPAVNPPRAILYNGQIATVEATQDSNSIQLTLQATMSSDRRFATITASATGKHRSNAVELAPSVTFSAPDGASSLIRIPLAAQPDSGNLWLIVKPTMIYQREAELQQFPTTNTRQTGQP